MVPLLLLMILCNLGRFGVGRLEKMVLFSTRAWRAKEWLQMTMCDLAPKILTRNIGPCFFLRSWSTVSRLKHAFF